MPSNRWTGCCPTRGSISMPRCATGSRLADALPVDIKVCIVADRGFGDQKLYRMLSEELKFDYVIRFRGNITVTTADGEARSAAAWVRPGGRARILRGALV